MLLYFSILFPLFIWTVGEIFLRIYSNGNNLSVLVSKSYKGSSLLFFVFSVFFIALVGFRGSTGSDTLTYKTFFDTNLYPDTMEKGYMFLSQLFSRLGISFTAFQVFISILTFLPIFIIYYKKSYSYAVVFLLFYLNALPFYAINISRQMVSVSFFMTGFFLLISSKKFNSFISPVFFYISFLFHKSMIIAILGLVLIYIIYFSMKKYDKSHYLLGVFLIIVIILFYKSVFIYNILTSLANNGALSDYTSFVTTSSAAYDLVDKNFPTLIMTLIESIIFLLPVFNSNKMDKETRILSSVFFVLVFVQSIQVGWITERLTQYFIPFTPILVTRILYESSNSKLYVFFKYVALVLFCMAAFVWFYRMVIHNFGTIYPYYGI
ncbi:EpsG family protein [Loigolactobacillus bifermentans]|uniref:EpsG family protein n=1 Tax=Loigolactobacillus bifermentans DSM 20003 TaxID=1423726 RepID=A0A0R1H110_9LACO|nr:EpsG family protein [Loigolactobacillus bifermentans]KRK39960.1 hypothetical protein FC07_GL001858 [Loigolactobacillus bifermentans DSM 20003]QGG58970.1 hypothetical protein LB003_00045 [Loigolactobacillus bifermentans]QGG61757.1 hypothetical protein LB003_15485 [Loigolactobacillus bifermentans]